jgi:hypothetical protein
MARKVVDVAKLQKDVESIYKTVYTGNGTPSITTQVAKLEGQINTLSSNLDTKLDSIETEMRLKFINVGEIVNEKFLHLSSQIKAEFEDRRHHHGIKHNFRTAIITSVWASVTSIVVLVLAEFIKRT